MGLQGGLKLGIKGIAGFVFDVRPPVIETSLLTGKRYASESYGLKFDIGKWSFGYDAKRSRAVGKSDIMTGELITNVPFKGGFQFGPYGVTTSEFGVFDAGFTIGVSINATFDFVDGS